MKANLAIAWLATAALAAQVVFKVAGPDVDVVHGIRSFALPALAYLGSAFAAILVFAVRERASANSARRTEQALQPDASTSAHNGKE
jgi:DNA-binding IclR family transcriptional regulator